jgi:hypothetical protein
VKGEGGKTLLANHWRSKTGLGGGDILISHCPVSTCKVTQKQKENEYQKQRMKIGGGEAEKMTSYEKV